MNKGKKWLRDELMKFKEITPGRYEDVIGVSHVLRVIDQLDEPEKVAVPQFVADALDYNKNPYWEVDEARIIAHILRCAFGDEAKPSEFLDWVRENPEDYVMAVKNGYVVRKEPTWVVKAVSGDYVDRFFNRGTSVQFFISSGVHMTEVHKFEDKSHADAVALLIKGTVEEEEE